MFGKGEISISIHRSNYLPGDMISGDITLTVKKPVKARDLSISLIGEQKHTHATTNSQGTSTTTETVRIYDFKQELDGQKEYSQGGTYHFDMKIPVDILGSGPPLPELTGGLAQGLKLVQGIALMTGGTPFHPTKWYLQAKLDIPGAPDISKTADITIG